ncbi:sucrose nonfermenting 4-like protein [Wolffia australiana]
MFAAGVDPGNDVNAAAGALLIPTRFVWPYGGRRVLLSGSFARWSEHIPMSPVEGCPTVFQVVCNLTPGFHQYKFFVDGEWRHDERQAFVTGKYGTVNTVLISKKPDSSATVPSVDTPTNRMNVDVDEHMIQQMDVSQRVPEADIDVSRHRISLFLSAHTAYELLPDSGKVTALDINLPVKQAFHILYEQGFPVAPLWDSYQGQFVGMLSAMDFILILRELASHVSNLTEEELETHTIAAWKEGKQQLCRPDDRQGRQLGKGLIHAGPYDSLKDVSLKILQNDVATVPIIHSPSADGSFPQLLHLASLSGILKCVCRQFRHSAGTLPILNQPVSAFRLGTWVPKIGENNERPLAMLRPNSPLSSVLSLLVQAQVSSIPIVDHNDSLLDIYCRSDITALAKDRAYAQYHIDDMSVQQALQLGQDAGSQFGVFNGLRCQMCLRSDSLQKVMERLANPGVRRVIIVEAGSKRVEGIISLSDMFRFLLGVG